jgi:V8-like Glu-specific endopeptidase
MTKFALSLVLTVLSVSFNATALPLPKMERTMVELPRTFTVNYNFEGIVALSNCSGSIVRLENSKDTDFAMVLTNGHCYEGGFIAPGTQLINQPSSRWFTVLGADASDLGEVRATTVLYATMTKTDMTLYRLKETYADIQNKFKIPALTLASQHPTAGMGIEIISGYWQRGYTCQIETFVNALREGDWTGNDSMRYSRPGCEVIGGTSGSPVLLQGSRTVIGINNTGNEDGKRCTDNNPCEIDKDGNISYQQGYNYAEQTYWIYSCLNGNGQIDMTVPTCMLPH